MSILKESAAPAEPKTWLEAIFVPLFPVNHQILSEGTPLGVLNFNDFGPVREALAPTVFLFRVG
ncbi:hypothetical protein GG496_001789 [Candidatus Fervidibacteria bacterium JGI MDM2 JNZ-1-D12]